MPTRIKVCGITRLVDAQLAVELGASALGFNFYSPSPRYIAPRAARAIIEHLPPFVAAVGVYADETEMEHVVTVARESGVGTIQLHGPRFPDPAKRPSGYGLIRAVTVENDFRAAMLTEFHADALLLDAFHPDLKGGTGRAFDWKLAREATRYGTIILAGGLNPENVGQAIRTVRPFAVDVASGVESAPGQKDSTLLRAFFNAVAEADREA